MSIAEKLMTIEEFVQLPDDGIPRELVRGRNVEMNVPTPRHGAVCGNLSVLIGGYVRSQGVGRIVTNDAGVITGRDPDTLRGADVSYYSFRRVSRGPVAKGYLHVAPEVVFEVLSEYDRWPAVLAKTAEYLDAGVNVVCVLDPDHQALQIFRADQAVRTLHADDDFTLPEFFADLTVPVREFFD